MAERVRLNKTLVEGLSAGESLRDTIVAGFAVRCQRQHKIYMLRACVNGKDRWITIGRHGQPWTVDLAREEAQRLWGEIRTSRGSKVGGRRLGVPRKTATKPGAKVWPKRPTVRDLGERFLDEYARDSTKPLSHAAYERNFRNHVAPLIGSMLVADVTREDIDMVRSQVNSGATARKTKSRKDGGKGGKDVIGGSGAANRVLALLSKMMNQAEEWEWRNPNSNPVRRMRRFKELKRERYLSDDELARIGDVVEEFEQSGRLSAWGAAAIRLLVFTGARLREILTLKWSYVDLGRRVLLLPDSKTGAKTINLNEAAVNVLKGLPRLEGYPWVLHGQVEGTHLKSIQNIWVSIRDAANVRDIRLHDLRHSYASYAVTAGGSLPMIGKLLGHMSPATTARYVHIANKPVAELAERTGSALAEAFGTGVKVRRRNSRLKRPT